MAGWNNLIQKRSKMHHLMLETGSGVTIASVSGQTFTVATKLTHIVSGIGYMDTDGIMAVATTGKVLGQVTFTRKAPITTSADKITYDLKGW